MKRRSTPAENRQKRVLMLWGLGWGYFLMFFVPLFNRLCWGYELNLSARNIVLQLAIWSLAGFGMGRWLQWRAGLIGKQYVKNKTNDYDKL